jgi:preprotein translocase subunit SecA
VENAQIKVENMHFESRKHLLEYDDVANEQRKTIYRFRKGLIEKHFEIKDKIYENFGEYIAHVLQDSGIIEGGAKEDFDTQKVRMKIKEDMNLDVPDVSGLEYEELTATIEKTIKENYEAKMSQIDEAQREEIERTIYLQTLDREWREHLYQMDTLKEGIRLRGYNQKDPLVEYKKESFNLFLELVESIKYEAVKTLMLVQFKFEYEDQEQEALEHLKQEMDESLENLEMGDSIKEPTSPITGGKKPKRNEPCPCGSGKKYKHCCGKSGPKKGMLA